MFKMVIVWDSNDSDLESGNHTLKMLHIVLTHYVFFEIICVNNRMSGWSQLLFIVSFWIVSVLAVVAKDTIWIYVSAVD